MPLRVSSARFVGREAELATLLVSLRRGSYRLVVRAVDAGGNRATARPRRFRIV